MDSYFIMEFRPNPGPQTEALRRNEFEILYGGARGGGKTYAGLLWLLYDIDNPNYRALVIRRNSEDLSDWIDRARQTYTPLGAKVIGKPAVIEFPSGAVIRTGHLKDENAYTKYQGHEYHRMLIEELTQIPTEESYLKLISSARSTVDGLKPQIFMTTNPGNIGHLRVKKRFIDVEAPGVPYYDSYGNSRIFIPAKVEDNPVLISKDPKYVQFLDSLPEDLKKAWRDGSRDVFDTKGAIFASYMQEAYKQERVCLGLYDSNLPVSTFWDLGVSDYTVILFVQYYGKEIRIIDMMYGDNDRGLQYRRPLIKDKYNYKNHYAPHDIRVKERGAGMSRLEAADNMGLRFMITPNTKKEDQIQAARLVFNQLLFEKDKTEKLREALSLYRKKYDEKNDIFGDPIHDWTSHFADAFMYMAVNYNIENTKPDTTPTYQPERWDSGGVL